jgi:PAS domain S-box-containing protein
MRTLIVASEGRSFGRLETVLRSRDHALSFVPPSQSDLERRCEDASLVFVDLRDGVDSARATCGRVSRPDESGPLVSLFGAPASLPDLELLFRAGAHVMLPDDDALVEFRVSTFEQAAIRRQRFVSVVRELRESHAKSSSIVESLQEGIIVQLPSGEVVATNASARRILGLDEADVVRRRWRGSDWVRTREDGSLIAMDDLPSITALRTGVAVRGFVMCMRNPEGKSIWISVNSQPVFADDSGKPTSVVTSMTDITERRLAEESLRALLDSANDGTIVHRDGVVIWVNRRGAELLGNKDAASYAGTRVSDIVAQQHRDVIAARVAEAARGNSPRPFRHTLSRADGTEVEIVTHTQPTVFEGRPALITYARDVTAERALEEQLRGADRLTALGRLAAGVGHEINNPLTFVIGNAQRALDGVKSGAPRKELEACLEEVLEGAERVRNIVSDLKVFSQKSSDEQSPVDVQRVLDACLRMAAAEIRSRARVSRVYDEVPAAFANEARLAQVFVNLLVNAAHAIPEGDAQKNSITVVTAHDPPFVVVSVTDTGGGIKPEHIDHVFEPFYTTKEDGLGTGLGLSISRQLVLSWGGRIELTSDVGKGTRVCVWIPVANGARASQEPALARPVPTTAASSSSEQTARTEPKRARVLVVDDEEPLGRLIRTILSAHEVTIATSGRDALARLERADAYDLVLCDLMMPDLTGMDLYETVQKAHPKLSQRIIFMTGGAFTPRAVAFLERIREAGLPCVEKPFRVDDLVTLVDERLRGE